MAEELEKKVNENEEDTIIKLNGFKRSMLEHLMKEKEYAKGTTFMEMDLGHIRELRKTHKASYTS